jgi:hypothetical protein
VLKKDALPTKPLDPESRFPIKPVPLPEHNRLISSTLLQYEAFLQLRPKKRKFMSILIMAVYDEKLLRRKIRRMKLFPADGPKTLPDSAALQEESAGLFDPCRDGIGGGASKPGSVGK